MTKKNNHNLIKTFYTITFGLMVIFSTINITYAADANILISKANEDRTQNNLKKLEFNQELTNAAQAKVNDMFANNYFAHFSPTGKSPWDFITASGYNYAYAGENLAIGYTDDAELNTAWMNSPDHRANILDKNYTQIGMAVKTAEFDGVKTTIVVQEFGAPMAIVTTQPVNSIKPQVVAGTNSSLNLQTGPSFNQMFTTSVRIVLGVLFIIFVSVIYFFFREQKSAKIVA